MEDVKLNGDSILHIFQILTELIKSGKDYRLKIVEWRDKRSLSQNSLYWLWLGELAQQTYDRIKQEHDTETFHEYFKQMYCKPKQTLLGKRQVEIRSTTKLDTGEMTYYLNQVEQWAIERGFKLTVPINCEYRELMDRQVQ